MILELLLQKHINQPRINRPTVLWMVQLLLTIAEVRLLLVSYWFCAIF